MQGGILLLISCQSYQNKREGIWKTINLVQTADLPTYFLSRSTKLSFFQFICEILLSVLNCNKFNFRSTKSLRVVTCGLWRNAMLQFSLIEDWLMVTTRGSLTPLGSILEVDWNSQAVLSSPAPETRDYQYTGCIAAIIVVHTCSYTHGTASSPVVRPPLTQHGLNSGRRFVKTLHRNDVIMMVNDHKLSKIFMQ